MRRRRKPVPVSHERWLVSYADFITLLFAFFTTMYAISSVDVRKMNAMVGSMQAAFSSTEAAGAGHTGGGSAGNAAPPRGREHLAGSGITPAASSVLPTVSEQAIRTQLESRLGAQLKSGLVNMSVDGRGLVISMREAGSFGTGSAELSATAHEVLREVARTLAQVGNIVRVEGHTDDVPINTDRYRNNFELSTARATHVIAFLIAEGLAGARLSAAGYGEFHPRAGNDSDVNRAQNRRVDLVVLSPRVSEREEPQLPR